MSEDGKTEPDCTKRPKALGIRVTFPDGRTQLRTENGDAPFGDPGAPPIVEYDRTEAEEMALSLAETHPEHRFAVEEIRQRGVLVSLPRPTGMTEPCRDLIADFERLAREQDVVAVAMIALPRHGMPILGYTKNGDHALRTLGAVDLLHRRVRAWVDE